MSHSTPEAELFAADLEIRTEGLPALQLWDKVLGRETHLDFEEDNQGYPDHGVRQEQQHPSLGTHAPSGFGMAS